MRKLLTPALGFPLLCAACLGAASSAGDRPNILVMMVDDLGFSDFGCYGGEIETPNIDRLAADGLRFTQFYNTAKCETSRVSLMTGLYANQAGAAALDHGVTIAEVLADAGYATSMAGKWHLENEPTDRGFSRYWGHLSGMTDFFHGDDTFRLNGEPWDDFAPDFYTTDANVDFSIRFIDESLETGRPFFHYIAFNAPHYPLQAPKADIEKYLGRYDVGWEEIRKARFARQQELGLFAHDVHLPSLPEHIPAWDDLSPHQRSYEGLRMAVFAAMVDRIDRNIGRLVGHLEARGELENTLIMLFSDNGGCPFERSDHLDIPPWKGGSFYLYDASWATVSNTPLRHYKQTQHEGGISSPLIVHWPARLRGAGSWERSPGHLIDIMATCINVAGTEYPPARDGREIEPLQGRSMLPLFLGESREPHEQLYFRFTSCRALRRGDWKAVSFYGHRWELYNIADDRVEQNNLADMHPELVAELSAEWYRMAREVDKLPASARKPVSNGAPPHNRDTWHRPEAYEGWSMPEF